MPASFALVKFDPGNDLHAHFVYDTFRRSINVWPWSDMAIGPLMDRLKREFASPGTETRIATPFGMEKDPIGWYSGRRQTNQVVYAYTKYVQRRQKIATVALASMGIDWKESCFLLFWTPASARIAEKHAGSLIFDTRGAWDGKRALA